LSSELVLYVCDKILAATVMIVKGIIIYYFRRATISMEVYSNGK